MTDDNENDGVDFFNCDIGEKIEANLLINTVEGSESSMAYDLTNNRPVMQAAGVALGAPVNPQLLIDFLRSDRPVSRDIRDWLADMLDPTVPTNANLRLSARAGNRKSNMLQYFDAVEAYLDRRQVGDGYDAAISEVACKFGITESLLKKAVTHLAAAKLHRENQEKRQTLR